MKIQDLSLAQLKEIVDGAPEGANSATDTQAGIQYCIWSIDKITQKWDEVWGWHNAPEFYRWPFIKLSDIRARINELVAQSNINVTLSAESIESKGVEQSETNTTQLDNEAALFNEPLTECELKAPEPESEKFHWYLVGYSYKNNVVRGDGSFYRFTGQKYESINKSLIADFELSARNIRKENDNGSLNLFISGISYLGYMTKVEFEGEKGE